MKNIFYTYILECNDKSNYYGHSNNLAKRIIEHSKGRVKSTKNKRPVQLFYYREFSSRSEAFKFEMNLKNGKTRKETIIKLIKSCPDSKMSRV